MDSRSISVRLPKDVIAKLDEIAEKRFISRGTMLQSWIRAKVKAEGSE